MQDLKLLHVRQEADALGIKWHHKHKIETIQKKIDDFHEGVGDEVPEEVPSPLVEQPVRSKDQERFLAKPVVPMTEKQYLAEKRREDRRKVSSLIHCKITCLNPDKRNWNGEFISVGSAKLGTWKKYVPFDGRPYHLPKIIYDMLKEKKCTLMQNGVDSRGRKAKIPTQINEFNIEVLPPLSKEELDELRVHQARAENAG
jgi:hypothetical protein